MTRAGCPANSDEIVELYFYDELPAGERAEAKAHFAVCAFCRESLSDLHAIQAALAARSVEAPDDNWAGFSARLDARLDVLDATSARSETYQPANPPTTWLKIAAAVALVASGAAGGWALSRFTSAAPESVAVVRPRVDRAIADAGDSGLERARVVLAGLAQKEEGAEWSLEQRMAATLLPEVRLIRQMAEAEARGGDARMARGRGELADVLIDVETLLLQASYAEAADPEALARLRGMIDRRDLLVRLSAASADNAPRLKRGL